VLTKVEVAACSPDYCDPTQTLPQPPPDACEQYCGTCMSCISLTSWRESYVNTVDDIISKSNIHHCSNNKNKDGTDNKARQYVGCLNNKWNKCKAKFPHPIVAHTTIDMETGAVNMKKHEEFINTLTPLVTYLLRCNTDVASLKSGTAIKAVILYVSDYITKSSLKTHVIFDTIRSIFHKNAEILGGDDTRKEKARKLMTKIGLQRWKLALLWHVCICWVILIITQVTSLLYSIGRCM
jgi:hypothetical protein